MPGFERPLVVALSGDNCGGCAGISLGVWSIAVDGLTFSTEFLSSNAFAASESDPNPGGRKIRVDLLGLWSFEHHFVLWQLEEQKPTGLTLRELDQQKNDPEDAATYRHYAVGVSPLADPKYYGPSIACYVHFD